MVSKFFGSAGLVMIFVTSIVGCSQSKTGDAQLSETSAQAQVPPVRALFNEIRRIKSTGSVSTELPNLVEQAYQAVKSTYGQPITNGDFNTPTFSPPLASKVDSSKWSVFTTNQRNGYIARGTILDFFAASGSDYIDHVGEFGDNGVCVVIAAGDLYLYNYSDGLDLAGCFIIVDGNLQMHPWVSINASIVLATGNVEVISDYTKQTEDGHWYHSDLGMTKDTWILAEGQIATRSASFLAGAGVAKVPADVYPWEGPRKLDITADKIFDKLGVK